MWDYPRPPALEPDSRRITITFAGETIADSTSTFRVLETSHPPVFYIPGADVEMAFMYPTLSTSWCEWKGRAAYWTVNVGDHEQVDAAWAYPSPVTAYAALAGHFAFYPSKMDECRVDEELITPQEGDFYGGWVTNEIVGPFNGGAGTWGW